MCGKRYLLQLLETEPPLRHGDPGLCLLRINPIFSLFLHTAVLLIIFLEQLTFLTAGTRQLQAAELAEQHAHVECTLSLASRPQHVEPCIRSCICFCCWSLSLRRSLSRAFPWVAGGLQSSLVSPNSCPLSSSLHWALHFSGHGCAACIVWCPIGGALESSPSSGRNRLSLTQWMRRQGLPLQLAQLIETPCPQVEESEERGWKAEE